MKWIRSGRGPWATGLMRRTAVTRWLRVSKVLVVASACTACLSCSDGGDDGELTFIPAGAGVQDNGPPAAAAPQAGAGAVVEGEAGADPALVGTYGVRIAQRDSVTVGVVGTASMRTVVLATAEIQADPESDALRLSLSFCDYRVAPDAVEKHLDDLALTLPSAVLSSTELDAVELTTGGGSGEPRTWRTGELHGVAGWQWGSPTDALPTSAQDARVFDQDEDGQPGVSAVFAGHTMGSLYLAMVFRWSFAGTVEENGDLSGENLSTCAETLLGSDQDSSIVSSFQRVPDPDPSDNTVYLARTPAPLSCAELLEAATDLFPSR